MAVAATERRLARNRRRAALPEARHLPVLHVEGFHDAIAGDGFVQNVLDFGQLVLAAARGVAHAAADLARRKDNHGHEQKQHPGQIPAQDHHHNRDGNKSEELLQKFRQHGRHGVLHALDVVDDG